MSSYSSIIYWRFFPTGLLWDLWQNIKYSCKFRSPSEYSIQFYEFFYRFLCYYPAALKSSSRSPSALFFLRIAVVPPGFLHVHVNFQMCLATCTKNIFFLAHSHCMQRFLGQGSNSLHSSDKSHSSDNSRS